MNRLYYCAECKRVIENDKVCGYCKGEDVKELTIKSPVNVIGTKIKGKIFNIKEEKVNVLIRTETKDKIIKEYKADQLKKLL